MISTKSLLWGLAALIGVDVVITLVAVGSMGATELNPLSNLIGFYGFMAAKVVLSTIALFVTYKYCLPAAPISARYGALTLGVVYAAVCASNMYHVVGVVA